MLNVANVGDVEVVICRRGEAFVLSKLFNVSSNKEEMERICKSGGIVTEVRCYVYNMLVMLKCVYFLTIRQALIFKTVSQDILFLNYSFRLGYNSMLIE